MPPYLFAWMAKYKRKKFRPEGFFLNGCFFYRSIIKCRKTDCFGNELEKNDKKKACSNNFNYCRLINYIGIFFTSLIM